MMFTDLAEFAKMLKQYRSSIDTSRKISEDSMEKSQIFFLRGLLTNLKSSPLVEKYRIFEAYVNVDRQNQLTLAIVRKKEKSFTQKLTSKFVSKKAPKYHVDLFHFTFGSNLERVYIYKSTLNSLTEQLETSGYTELSVHESKVNVLQLETGLVSLLDLETVISPSPSRFLPISNFMSQIGSPFEKARFKDEFLLEAFNEWSRHVQGWIHQAYEYDLLARETMLEFATKWFGGLVQNWCNGLKFEVTINRHNLVIESRGKSKKTMTFDFSDSIPKNSQISPNLVPVQHQILNKESETNRNLIEIVDADKIHSTKTTAVYDPKSDQRTSLTDQLLSKTPQIAKIIMENLLMNHKAKNQDRYWQNSIVSILSANLLDHDPSNIDTFSVDFKGANKRMNFDFYQYATHIEFPLISSRFFILQQSDKVNPSHGQNDVIISVLSSQIDTNKFTSVLKHNKQKMRLSDYCTLIQISVTYNVIVDFIDTSDEEVEHREALSIAAKLSPMVNIRQVFKSFLPISKWSTKSTQLDGMIDRCLRGASQYKFKTPDEVIEHMTTALSAFYEISQSNTDPTSAMYTFELLNGDDQKTGDVFKRKMILTTSNEARKPIVGENLPDRDHRDVFYTFDNDKRVNVFFC